MSQILFEFAGSSVDGCKIEGGGGGSLSTANRDPVPRHWFGTNLGTPGEQFYIFAGNRTPPQDHPYAVVDRNDGDDQVVVHAEHIPDLRD